MRREAVRRRAAGPAAAAMVALAGALAGPLACGERMRPVAEPRQSPRPAAYLAVAEVAGEGAVRVTALTTGAVDPASFTARLHFDPAAVTAVREDTLADGAARAVHVQRGVVRVAGVAPRGLGGRPLFALRVEARAAAALASLRLELVEMHDARRADLRPVVRTLPGAARAAAPR